MTTTKTAESDLPLSLSKCIQVNSSHFPDPDRKGGVCSCLKSPVVAARSVGRSIQQLRGYTLVGVCGSGVFAVSLLDCIVKMGVASITVSVLSFGIVAVATAMALLLFT